MEKYAELCDEAVGTLLESDREEACRDRDAAYTDFENWTRRARGGHKTESCAGGEGKGKLWGLNRDQRASLEQGIAGNAFATAGRTYSSGQGMETFSREEWRQKMGTEEGA